jgi:hypothetical protein
MSISRRFIITVLRFNIIFFASFIFGFTKAQVPISTSKAFLPGEQLDYSIHYGIIQVGTARLQVADKLKTFNGKKCFYYYARGLSSPGWDYFFKVRDYYYSYADTSTLLPAYALREVREGDFSNREQFIFNRNENIVIAKNEPHRVPSDVMDLLAAIFYARCIDYDKVALNKEIPFSTFFENELFPVTITYEGKVKIKTKFGYIQCLVIRPKLVEGRVFKGQKDMTIYISDDLCHVPVKVKTAIFVGYIEADLVSFRNTKTALIFSPE